MSAPYDTHRPEVNGVRVGKQAGKSEAKRLREWLVFVIATETRPNFDHVITRWRRWQHLVRMS